MVDSIQPRSSGTPEERRLYERLRYPKRRERHLAYFKEYRQRNKNERAAKDKEYYENNKAKVCAQRKEYRARKKEAIRIKKKQYYEETRERFGIRKRQPAETKAQKLAKKKEYYQRNIDRLHEYQRRNATRHAETSRLWAQTPKGRLFNVLKAHRRRKTILSGDLTAEQVKAVWRAYKNRCAYCDKRETQRKRLTIDHVIPVIKGGQHGISNIVPACRSCNAKKKDNPPPLQPPIMLLL